MRLLTAVFVLAAASVAVAAAQPAGFLFPRIAHYGGIVALPEAAEQPRAGAKAVFDITVASEPEEVSKGLESVARYLNLHAQAGHSPAEVKLALVLHGQASDRPCTLSLSSAYPAIRGFLSCEVDPYSDSNIFSLTAAPYDPYLHVWATGRDVHLPGRTTLARAPHLYRSQTNPADAAFQSESGWRWALLVPSTWVTPGETEYIGRDYPEFDAWRRRVAASEG